MYRNLVAQSIATKGEAFKRIRDWLCMRNGSYDYSVTGLGWTLHDSVYAVSQDTISANDYFVVKSVGESGNEDIYVKFTYVATVNIIQVTIHQYWNNTTHVGVNNMTPVSNLTILDATVGNLYIYGNLDFFIICTSNSWNQCLVGKLTNPMYDTTVATSASSVSAGASRVVTMNTVPASWVVGGKVIVRDTANMERIIISGINGNDVTFTNFVTGYLAGCKFSKDYPIVCSNAVSIIAAYVWLFTHAGTKMAVVAAQTQVAIPGISGNPDGLDNEYMATPFEMWDDTHGYFGSFNEVLNAGTATNWVSLTIYTTPQGVNYRYFNMATSAPVLIKEV